MIVGACDWALGLVAPGHAYIFTSFTYNYAHNVHVIDCSVHKKLQLSLLDKLDAY